MENEVTGDWSTCERGMQGNARRTMDIYGFKMGLWNSFWTDLPQVDQYQLNKKVSDKDIKIDYDNEAWFNDYLNLNVYLNLNEYLKCLSDLERRPFRCSYASREATI